jgi:hypothetical protein
MRAVPSSLLVCLVATAGACGSAPSAPSASCESSTSTGPAGKRQILVPPRPEVRAVAVTVRTTRIEWSLGEVPSECRARSLLVSVHASRSSRATPRTEYVEARGSSGSTEIVYADFLPPPDVALVSALTADGRRSETVSVRIDRSGDVRPDPPDPLPPVTAPAGEPVTCAGNATTVSDPAADVLTYAVGSPPARVDRMTPALSGIDIVRASVHIDGRTLCATFELVAPPPPDFALLLVLRDTSTVRCCAALRLVRRAGRVQVGSDSTDVDGQRVLEPVAAAGASIRGRTLVLTGTLPAPGEWRLGSRRMPAADELGWSATSTYTPEKYGPYFGDWLPGYADSLEPIVRHRDGATVSPGS